MRLHETPISLARALAAHAPQHLRTLLDPASGRGSLITPFLGRHDLDKVVAVDRRRCCERQLTHLSSESQVEFVHGDFLQIARQLGTFDCIVMNPPFSARRRTWVSSQYGLQLPIEAAFVRTAVELLNPDGRLLAILPASVISAKKLSAFRSALLDCGSIRLVHEVPAGSFKKADVTVYLFVYEKSRRVNSIHLCNSNLLTPERIQLTRGRLGPDARLDFGYQMEKLQKYSLECALPTVRWERLDNMANIVRGSSESPVNRRAVIHTTSATGIIWNTPATRSTSSGTCLTRPGDILIQRVG